MQKLSFEDAQKWYKKNKASLLEDFFSFLKFKSVSADSSYKGEVIACSKWLKEYLEKMGVKVSIWETKGNPIVFGELIVDKSLPTILLYQHYDVQPEDPIELWKTDPFNPTIKDGCVYARGALDNKGQCFASMCALRAYIDLCQDKKCNIKILIEGEEEVGSFSLDQILKEKKEEVKADSLLIVDLDMRGENKPAITLGMRGITTFEITCKNANVDVHSGSYGGMIVNPAISLTQALSSCFNEDGSVAVPGFYDGTSDMSEADKKTLNWEFDPKELEEDFGIKAVRSEGKYSPLESNWIRPSFEINGMHSGYTKEGSKTIIPSSATAKLSFRLVPGQDPERIIGIVSDFLKKKMPKGIDVEILRGHGGVAVRTDVNAEIVGIVKRAYEKVFRETCHYVLTGATIPIAPALVEATKADLVFMGFGIATDGIHAPNEKFGLNRLEKGIYTLFETFISFS